MLIVDSGLGLKDYLSRTYLITLLDALERMKAAIGDNDAIHDDSASSAYVENFALGICNGRQ